ncbi:MAG: LuxR C-terminal-related transcriptional regulator [Solirubrobacteraceae bacterium]
MELDRPVTVVLARFEDLINAGLRNLIEDDPHLRIVASEIAPDALDAVIAERGPRVALLNLAALQAPSEVRRLHAAHPETRLVVLANRPTPGECSQLLALGATACLGKEVQARDVLNTIHLASRGLHVLPYGNPVAVSDGHEVLTPREADVLDQLQLGRSNSEIAAALSVSIETVRTHARSVFRKLGVHSRRELKGLSR